MSKVTRLSSDCPMCKAPLRRVRRRDGSGEFTGCSRYPKCEFVESIDLNVERIERDLQAAESDVEYLKTWRQIVTDKIKSIGTCDDCQRHIDDLRRLL